MGARKKRCLHCKRYADISDGIVAPVGFFCSQIHVMRYVRAKRKDQRKIHFARKKALRPRSWYLREAQKQFNRYIRLRDGDLPCISCGRHHRGQYHAGHFRSVGSCPELRFEESNCHKQCAPCNNVMSGNLILYRKHLIEKVGQEKVDWLEGPHSPLKPSIEDLQRLAARYKSKCKALEGHLG